MKYANFYDLESLTLLNRHEGCACSIKEGTPFMPVEQSQTFQVVKISVLHIEIVFVGTI